MDPAEVVSSVVAAVSALSLLAGSGDEHAPTTHKAPIPKHARSVAVLSIDLSLREAS